MLIYKQSNDAITAYGPDGSVAEDEFWMHTDDSIVEPIFEEHDVPIYKFSNGHVINRSQAEIDYDISQIKINIQIPDQERIAACEEAILALMEGLYV